MNRYVKYIAAVLLLLLAGTYSCELEKVNSCPCIRSISPDTARAGDLITLTGDFENFNLASDKVIVGANGSLLNLKKETGELIGTVPSGISKDKVSIKLNSSNCPSPIENCINTFDYKKVTVTEINPNIGRKEQTITIKGSNFNTQDPSLNRVLFGTVPSPNVLPISENELSVTVPTGAETADVVVNVDGFEANAGQFTYFYSVVGTVKEISPDCCTQAEDGFSPKGIAADSDGNIYVADNLANQIFRIDVGTTIMKWFAGSQLGNPGVNDMDLSVELEVARFTLPFDLAFDGNNNLYITDTGEKRIRKINLSTELVSVHATTLNLPFGIAADKDKNVFFSDNSVTIKLIPENLMTIQDYDGIFSDPSDFFNNPTGLWMNEDGNLFVADAGHNRIRYIEAGSRNVINVAGNGEPIYHEGPANFNQPTDIEIDDNGNTFVVDSANKLIRVITSTGLVYSLHGSGFTTPFSLTLYEDKDNDQKILYVSDTDLGVVKKLIYE